MSPDYYIALLPELSSDFYDKINSLCLLKCYPEFRLPFHATLFFFGKVNSNQKREIEEWMNRNFLMPRITVKTKGINYFELKQAVVYFLELESSELVKLNDNIRKNFPYLNNDSLPFLPHLSLFFTKKKLVSKDYLALQEAFEKFPNIKFKGAYLGGAIDRATKMEKYIPLV